MGAISMRTLNSEAVLGIPGSHTVRPEVRAKMVSYVAQRHRVVNWERQGFIETQPGREQSVVSVEVRRAPVVGKRSVQALCPVRVNPPEGLARHPVQEEVPGLAFPCRRREFSRIVG